MKGKKAKVNRIFSAAACLAAALALAVFSCFAWFVSNNSVNNDMSATVSDGNILDLAVQYYSLTGKTDTTSGDVTTTTYSVYENLDIEKGGTVIGGYSSNSATLIKVTYTVKGELETKLIFSGSGAATFPAEAVTTTDESTGLDLTSYLSYLSNAVSLRLASVTESGDTPTSVSTYETAQTFCNADDLSGTEEQTIDKSNVVFSGITTDDYGAESTDNSGYYDITVYLVMEYNDDNVIALYPSGATYSSALNFNKDITLAVKDSSGDDTTSGGSSGGETGGETGGDSGDSGDSGGETGGEEDTVTLSYDMSDYYNSLSSVIGNSDSTIYFNEYD